MKMVIGAAIVAGAWLLAGPATANSATAASPRITAQTVGTSDATDFSAQRNHRRLYSRPSIPYYYARPTYYRPYPYSVPAPFTFGFNYGPYW
jgi:hypothetical protein